MPCKPDDHHCHVHPKNSCQLMPKVTNSAISPQVLPQLKRTWHQKKALIELYNDISAWPTCHVNLRIINAAWTPKNPPILCAATQILEYLNVYCPDWDEWKTKKCPRWPLQGRTSSTPMPCKREDHYSTMNLKNSAHIVCSDTNSWISPWILAWLGRIKYHRKLSLSSTRPYQHDAHDIPSLGLPSQHATQKSPHLMLSDINPVIYETLPDWDQFTTKRKPCLRSTRTWHKDIRATQSQGSPLQHALQYSANRMRSHTNSSICPWTLARLGRI